MPITDYSALFPDLGLPHLYDGSSRFSTHDLLQAEFDLLGFTCRNDGGMLFVERDGATCAFVESETSFTSLVSFRVLKDKRQANRLFTRHGISVAEQHSFSKKRIADAEPVVARLGSVVVKPADGSKGRGVSVGVTVETLHHAWEAASAETSSSILVEKHFRNGIEARYLVIDGVCSAVVRRVPPHVRGDGQSTIAALIELRNGRRARNPHLASRPILMNGHRKRIISNQGFDLESVPQVGQLVIIDTLAGLSTGGDALDITESVHPGMRAVVERAARILPGLDVVGFDVLAHDHTLPPQPDSYIIVEGNTRPGLGGHIYPSYGEPRNVCRMIAESCLRKMGLEVPPPQANRPAMAAHVAEQEDDPTPARDDELPVIAVAAKAATVAATNTLVLGGDTCLGHSYLTKKWPDALSRLLNTPTAFFAGLDPLTSDRDAMIVNLETVLTNAPTDIFGGKKKYLGWDDPTRTSATLRKVGVDAVTVANNHFMDFGPERAAETIRHLDHAGIPAAGYGKTQRDAALPLHLMIGEVPVFMFSSFEIRQNYRDRYRFYAGPSRPGVHGFGDDDGDGLTWLIGPYRAAHPDSFIIFAPHWGGAQNYGWATDEMERLGAAALVAGADVVIGHGAHAAQELDFHEKGTIVYSIGNFVFNSPGRYQAEGGFPFSFVARLMLLPGQAQLRLYPFLCDNRITNFSNRPVTADEFAEVQAVLGGRPLPRSGLKDQVTAGRDARGFYLEPTKPLSPRFQTIKTP